MTDINWTGSYSNFNTIPHFVPHLSKQYFDHQLVSDKTEKRRQIKNTLYTITQKSGGKLIEHELVKTLNTNKEEKKKELCPLFRSLQCRRFCGRAQSNKFSSRYSFIFQRVILSLLSLASPLTRPNPLALLRPRWQPLNEGLFSAQRRKKYAWITGSSSFDKDNAFTSTGFIRIFLARASIWRGNVAENMTVCLSGLIQSIILITYIDNKNAQC